MTGGSSGDTSQTPKPYFIYTIFVRLRNVVNVLLEYE